MVPPMRFRLGGKSKGHRIKILLIFYSIGDALASNYCSGLVWIKQG